MLRTKVAITLYSLLSGYICEAKSKIYVPISLCFSTCMLRPCNLAPGDVTTSLCVSVAITVINTGHSGQVSSSRFFWNYLFTKAGKELTLFRREVKRPGGERFSFGVAVEASNEKEEKLL